MPFSFCVLSAVSQESQATEDKDSLDHQLRTARAYGEGLGGAFVREYRADGFSRSGYWSLPDLFHDAPPFAELMDEERQKEAAKRRQAEREDGIKSFHDIVTHPKFLTWITEAEPREVQFWLGKYFRITAYKDKTIRVEFA